MRTKNVLLFPTSNCVFEECLGERGVLLLRKLQHLRILFYLVLELVEFIVKSYRVAVLVRDEAEAGLRVGMIQHFVNRVFDDLNVARRDAPNRGWRLLLLGGYHAGGTFWLFLIVVDNHDFGSLL